MKLLWKIILGIIFLVVLGLIIYNATDLTPTKCLMKKGRILNTLGGEIDETGFIEPATCELNETSLGPIRGLQCPCICCVPS